MEELLKILDGFPKKKILIIGDIMLDKYTEGKIERISPEAPVPVLSVYNQSYKIGGAGNVALNAANLSPGGEIHFSGFIGLDKEADHLTRLLEEKKIKTYFEKKSSTIVKERFIGKSSGHTQHLIRVDKEDTSPKILSSEIKAVLNNISQEADIIIISDYAKGAITNDLLNSLSSYKNKIIVDPKPKNPEYKSSYKGVYLITPNRKEAFEMTGLIDIYEAGKKLTEDFNSNILIKLGGDGSIIFPISGDPIKIPTINEVNFEETGAGDTTMAALALSLSVNKSLQHAARISNYASRITIKNIGTYAPTLDELRNFILNEKNDKQFI